MPRQKEPLRPTPTGRIFWPSTLPAGVDSAPTHRSVRRCRRAPSPALVADMKRRPEGLARYTNLHGTAVYTAWTFTRHGWGVGFATPSAPVDNAFWHHLFLFGF